MVVYLRTVAEIQFKHNEDCKLSHNNETWEKYKDVRADGHRDDVIKLLRDIVPVGEEALDDYYFMGQGFFELEEYHLAIDMLTQCIDIGKHKGISWYQDTAYLLRAYAFIEKGKYKEAKEDIDFVADDTRIAWLYRHPETEINKSLVIQKLNALTAKTPSATPNRKHSPKPR